MQPTKEHLQNDRISIAKTGKWKVVTLVHECVPQAVETGVPPKYQTIQNPKQTSNPKKKKKKRGGGLAKICQHI